MDEARPAVDYESTPLTRPEYISAIVHLYRGELDRATTWRLRLDATTNWAVLTTAGVLSYSFGDPRHTHFGPLLGIAFASVFWMIEARRYRYADIWYARVRMLEENFYGPILRRDLVSPERDWGALLAADLQGPRFRVTHAYALRKRLLRNYWAIFGVLLGAWAMKLTMHAAPASAGPALRERLAMGLLPWWFAPATVAAFVVGLLALVAFGGRDGEERPD